MRLDRLRFFVDLFWTCETDLGPGVDFDRVSNMAGNVWERVSDSMSEASE